MFEFNIHTYVCTYSRDVLLRNVKYTEKYYCIFKYVQNSLKLDSEITYLSKVALNLTYLLSKFNILACQSVINCDPSV